MASYLYLMLALIRLVNSLSEEPCDRILIGNQWYDKEILWKYLGRPYSLNIHRQTNILFFSHSMSESTFDVDLQLTYLNLDTKDFTNIPGIKGGWTSAVDQTTDDVYLGGDDGIYKYNMATKVAEFYKEKGKNIWSLFYRQNLFYISYPDQKLYMEIDGNFAIVKEFQNFEVDQFYVAENGYIYFSNSSGIYEYNKTNARSDLINDLITVREFTEDNNGTTYACTNVGLYILKDRNLRKVSDMRNVLGLAFDRDNHFVLSDDKCVMKLVISNEGCYYDDRS